MSTLPPRPPLEQVAVMPQTGLHMPAWRQWFGQLFDWLRPTGSTGAGSANLGANCPASELAAPYVWEDCIAPDGTPCVRPMWKK